MRLYDGDLESSTFLSNAARIVLDLILKRELTTVSQLETAEKAIIAGYQLDSAAADYFAGIITRLTRRFRQVKSAKAAFDEKGLDGLLDFFEETTVLTEPPFPNASFVSATRFFPHTVVLFPSDGRLEFFRGAGPISLSFADTRYGESEEASLARRIVDRRNLEYAIVAGKDGRFNFYLLAEMFDIVTPLQPDEERILFPGVFPQQGDRIKQEMDYLTHFLASYLSAGCITAANPGLSQEDFTKGASEMKTFLDNKAREYIAREMTNWIKKYRARQERASVFEGFREQGFDASLAERENKLVDDATRALTQLPRMSQELLKKVNSTAAFYLGLTGLLPEASDVPVNQAARLMSEYGYCMRIGGLDERVVDMAHLSASKEVTQLSRIVREYTLAAL